MTTPDSSPIGFRSRWAFLPGGELGENVAVEIVGGRVARVGRPRGGETDLGDRLMLPGLVNAHVHLELSGFPALPTDRGFLGWALRLGMRRARTPRAALADAAARALDTMLAEGVSCVGEVATTGAAAGALAARGLAGVWYQEMIDPAWLTARSTLRRGANRAVRGGRSSGLAPGLIPHAPYSVSAALYAASARHARPVPLATHASETAWETGLFRRSGGTSSFLVRMLLGRRLARSGARSPVAWLARTGFLATRPALIHATHLDGADVDLIRACGARVVVCPRSSSYFGEGPVDVGRLIRARIPVGIGTDSPASAGTHSVREELRTLARVQPGLSPRELLLSATESGAAALGRQGRSGVLATGARGDVAVVDVEDARAPLSSVLTDARSRLVALAGVPVVTTSD